MEAKIRELLNEVPKIENLVVKLRIGSKDYEIAMDPVPKESDYKPPPTFFSTTSLVNNEEGSVDSSLTLPNREKERKYSCDFCDLKFFSSSIAKKHMEISCPEGYKKWIRVQRVKK